MKNAGCAVSEGPGNLQEFGNGYTINTAVYHLRGGFKAQTAFLHARQKDFPKRFKIDISGDLATFPTCTYTGALVELRPEERFWMTSALRRQTKEYGTNPTSIPHDPQPTTSVPPKRLVQPSTPELKTLEFTKASPESEDSMGNLNHSPSPSESYSLPDSDFTVNCRCGVNGDGNVLYRTGDEGAAVKCEECGDLSHIACQRDGRASALKDKDEFICDFCDALNLLRPQYHEKERESKRNLLNSRVQLKKPLRKRLIAGRGGLARNGDFWYPVRLIDHQTPEKVWMVRWWRECQFEQPNTVAPGTITAVAESDVVDSLWGDRTARRKIRLGQWTHAHDIPTVEDILADPSFISYTPEMHAALAPSIKILQALLTHPEEVENVPAKTWLKDQGKNIQTAIVPFTGNLSIIERAQLGNWFDIHVALKDPGLRRHWLGLLPFAHTCTLWLVALLQRNKGELQKFYVNDDEKILEAAWQLQTSHSLKETWKDRIDVDKEYLERLEEEMFERSALAGKAGDTNGA